MLESVKHLSRLMVSFDLDWQIHLCRSFPPRSQKRTSPYRSELDLNLWLQNQCLIDFTILFTLTPCKVKAFKHCTCSIFGDDHLMISWLWNLIFRLVWIYIIFLKLRDYFISRSKSKSETGCGWDLSVTPFDLFAYLAAINVFGPWTGQTFKWTTEKLINFSLNTWFVGWYIN